MPIFVKFEGIDSHGRAVFRDTTSRNRYGEVSVAFSHDATQKEVLAKCYPPNFEYFGTRFGCEPEGTPPNDTILVEV